MAIRIEHVGDVAIVIAEGHFVDEEQINELDRALTKLVVEDGQERTLVHVGGVRHMNSLGFSVIFRAQSQAEKRGATLYVCGLTRASQSGLTVMGNVWVGYFEDCDEALKALQEV